MSDDPENFDDFSSKLLDEAKYFLEKAKASSSNAERDTHLHACILIGFCALEAQINAISADLIEGHGVELIDRAILAEREIVIKNGVHELGNLKISRLEDRIQHLFAKFSTQTIDKTSGWWPAVIGATKIRNRLTHPKGDVKLKVLDTENALKAIIDCVNHLYKAIYKRPFPMANVGLVTSLDF